MSSHQARHDPETPLEKIASNTVPVDHNPYNDHLAAPVEAHTAKGPTMMAEAGGMLSTQGEERKSSLIFKRLRKDLPLPSAKTIMIMT